MSLAQQARDAGLMASILERELLAVAARVREARDQVSRGVLPVTLGQAVIEVEGLAEQASNLAHALSGTPD